jgi:hypothetical protein
MIEYHFLSYKKKFVYAHGKTRVTYLVSSIYSMEYFINIHFDP